MNSNARFRLKLAEIASKIEKEKLERLKFLCTHLIPDGDREKISSPERLFTELEHRRELAPNRLIFLQKCLEQVGRHDLAYELKAFDWEGGKKIDFMLCQSTAAKFTVVNKLNANHTQDTDR